LRPMSGRQGLDAILNPVPGLVAPEVAREIVRFIGRPSAEDTFGIIGDAAEGFEVEPSLLSLVCRELNERRIARGLDQIGSELLAGSRDEIIEGFYERCLADQPGALRAFVEDRLLSDSGYRESITLDSARRALSDAGVPAGALDELVRRDSRYSPEAYEFVFVALTHTQKMLGRNPLAVESGREEEYHVSGPQLLEGVRDLAGWRYRRHSRPLRPGLTGRKAAALTHARRRRLSDNRRCARRLSRGARRIGDAAAGGDRDRLGDNRRPGRDDEPPLELLGPGIEGPVRLRAAQGHQ